MIKNDNIYINGDGQTSRDFCFIENAVQANILAATTTNKKAQNNIYNIALGDRTSLNELYALLQAHLLKKNHFLHAKLNYRDFREGDVKHSQADISKAKKLLGYRPTHRVNAGIVETVNWHLQRS
jgi:UDP-N-acetylglucosamine 4-epimerase